MDLDGDGRSDILSGSWPGEIYFFRRQTDGKFGAGVQLKGHDGKSLNVGSASAAFAADWDGDGALDLVVGTVLGEVWLVPGAAKGKPLAFAKPRRLEAAGRPIKVQSGDAAPAVADWDGDGQPDLIVGAEDGSVVWYRNEGKVGAPRLATARLLVGPSPVGWKDDDRRGPRDWGLRVKPCVFDWDGDGRPDLLLGDRCGGFQGKDAKEGDALRVELQRLKDEIAVVQKIQGRYEPGSQSHGFVWLFLRKPASAKSEGLR